MNGPHRLLVWFLTLCGATVPFITLRFILPPNLLIADGYIPIPEVLVSDFSFIGVALFIACAPEWMADEHYSTFGLGRQRTILVLRALTFVFAFLTFLHYLRISLYRHNVFETRFQYSLDDSKDSLMWCIVAVIVLSFAAVFFHQGGSNRPDHA